MPILTRRATCALMLSAVTSLTAAGARAETVLELTWDDLIPDRDAAGAGAYEALGIVSHDQILQSPAGDGFAPINTELDGKLVRIPGYVVPLDFESTGVTTFLLVPYVGACVHVPPPPSNQLILVHTDIPREFGGLFEPVVVTGIIGAAAAATELADVGYALQAEDVAPYEGQ